MRFFLALVLLLTASLAAAAEEPVEREIRALEWRLYDRVEFPLRLRQIDSEIKLTEARLESQRKLLAEYQSFQRFSAGNPLTLTVEETKLQILASRLRLDNLREERSLLLRYRDDQRRLFELRAK